MGIALRCQSVNPPHLRSNIYSASSQSWRTPCLVDLSCHFLFKGASESAESLSLTVFAIDILHCSTSRCGMISHLFVELLYHTLYTFQIFQMIAQTNRAQQCQFSNWECSHFTVRFLHKPLWGLRTSTGYCRIVPRNEVTIHSIKHRSCLQVFLVITAYMLLSKTPLSFSSLLLQTFGDTIAADTPIRRLHWFITFYVSRAELQLFNVTNPREWSDFSWYQALSDIPELESVKLRS